MAKLDVTEDMYLKLLSREYPSIAAATAEVINLQAILNLPKGTEHFLTDIHGEYEQFLHVLKNGSGAIRRKIEEQFESTLSAAQKRTLATLIYYPEKKLELILENEENVEDWYRVNIYRLVQVCRAASSKYTRSKVRKALPKDFAYIIDELLAEKDVNSRDQVGYYNEIINSVIRTGRAKELVIALCNTIRRFVVDHLHVLGDIFDRGPRPHDVMEALIEHHSVDITWGNHDVIWMGAAAGETCCMANLLRISAKYGNLDILEDGYGINLIPLMRLALEVYKDDPCDSFKLSYREDEYDGQNEELDQKMHKAIAVIQFKLEGQKMLKHPEFDMNERLIMHTMDLDKGTVVVEGKTYELTDTYFPTFNPDDPYALSKEEEEVVEHLRKCFISCERLQRHIQFLYAKGSLYKVYNGNLLYHGCVPLNEDGTFKEVEIYGKKYSGKELYDTLDSYARKAYYSLDKEEKQKGMDIMWYIWENKNSPVFGKGKMTTFERYFIADKATHKEPKNPYYKLMENEEVVTNILAEFNLTGEEAHIVNGHVPVEQKKGESPIKCNGKLLLIDGGFSKAYQGKTGIAGYTLVYNSYGLMLAAHEPFVSVDIAVEQELDIHSDKILVQKVNKRKLVADTDVGKEIKENILGLERLIEAYRTGYKVTN